MTRGQQSLIPARRERGAALQAANLWLRQIRALGVTVDPVLTVALQDAARALDRARTTDAEGGRMAYVSRELRAARLDVVGVLPGETTEDPWRDFYAADSSSKVRDPA